MHLNLQPLIGKSIAILGATGQVGRRLISTLALHDYPIETLTFVAQDPKSISYGTATVKCQTINDVELDSFDIIFNCMPESVMRANIGSMWNDRCIIIDKSSAFRMDEEVPLIVPEVNWDSVGNAQLIASPNCVVIPLVMVISPILQHLSDITQVSVSTYQSVSGAGNAGMTALLDENKKSFFDPKVQPAHFEKQIAYNILPKIGEIDENGATDEENKISRETNKILGQNLPIAVTAVRVPVLISHCVALHVACTCKSLHNITTALMEAEGIELIPDNKYVTPIEASHEDPVYVSRLRRTSSGIAMWITCDNIGKGAALNALQIALKKFS